MLIKYLREKDILIPLGISLCWLIALAGTLPFGNFPLNDDWAYAQSVTNLLTHNRFVINNWPGMTLFFHVIWGTLFCKIFGFSFLTLRLSTIFIGLIGIFAGYHLFSTLSKNKFSVVISVLLLAFNPFYFSLSLTFMTDVSFTTFTILAALFFSKYLISDKRSYLFLAVCFCIISVLIRQMGLLLPLAFLPALLLKERFTLKNAILSLTPFIITLTTLNLFVFWLEGHQNLPADFGKTSVIFQNIFHGFYYFLWDKSGLIIFYIVAISIPVSLYGFSDLWKSSSRKLKISSLIVVAILLIFIHNKFYSIPIENIFYNFGIGPRLLKDAFWDFTKFPRLPKDLVNFINIIVLLFVLPFVLKILSRIGKMLPSLMSRDTKTNAHELIYLSAVLFLFLYSIFLIYNKLIFDRYFLPLYPFILALVIPFQKIEISSKLKFLSVAFIGLIALFSIMAVHDYFSWNRARWAAANYLLKERKVSSSLIDGGFEFNGWYSKPNLKRSLSTEYSKSWWFVEDDQYLIAFGNMDGYYKIKSYPFFSFFPIKHDSILVLERKPYNSQNVIMCNMESFTTDKKRLLSTDSLYCFNFSGSISHERKHSGSYSLMLTNANKSGLNIRLKDFKKCEKVIVTIWKYPGTSNTGISIVSNFRENFNLFVNDIIIEREPSGWVKIKSTITIPEEFGKSEIEFSTINKGNSACWVDDFELIRLIQ